MAGRRQWAGGLDCFRMKARNVDRSVIGVGEGVIGPIERKLNEFGDLLGLVVGA